MESTNHVVEAAGIESASEQDRQREPTCLVRSSISATVGGTNKPAAAQPDQSRRQNSKRKPCRPSRKMTPATGVRARRPELPPVFIVL